MAPRKKNQATEQTAQETAQVNGEQTTKEAEQTGGEQTTKEAEQTGGEQTTKEAEQTGGEQTTKEAEQTGGEQTAQETEQTSDEQTAQEAARDEFADIPSPCVYCGPSVRGVARQYTTYQGGLPNELKEFIKAHPAARRLIVPTSKFAGVRKRLETPGTAEALVYKKVKSEL